MKTEPIITWKDWQDGIADSPHLGHALLQGVEIDYFAGSARTAKLPITAFHTTYTSVFTASAATDIMTSTATVPATGTAVIVSNSGGALPTGLAAATNYFIIKLSATTFKLATTVTNADAGTAINITTDGTGTQTVVTVDPGTINHYAADPRTATTFAMDSSGRIWYASSGSPPYRLLNGNTLTNASGQGMAVFRVSDGSATYLFAFRNKIIDVVNVFDSTQLGAPSWTNGWQTTMNTGAGSPNSHHAILGQDNIIYYCDDRYIGSILEKAGQIFDPSNAATYTWNNQALDLPLGSLCYWLEQLGVNLLISVSNDYYVYPWDRSSDSYGLPIPIGEYSGNKMKNIGNMVYILAGTRGNIYWTQGTYVRPFKTIPTFLSNNGASVASNPVTWGGIGAVNGKLLVGVGALSGRSGAYLIDAQGHLTVDNIPSIGAARCTAFYATNDFYQMGYAGGADTMDTSRYSSLGTVILQSPLYRLGDATEKEIISKLEYQIATGVNGSIRVGYRTDIAAAFTTLTTFTTTTSASSDIVDVGLIDLQNIQFQVELSGVIDFMELRCYR